MKYGKIRPQGKVIDHWQLLHESDFEDTDTKLLLHLNNEVTDWATGKTVTNSNVTFSSSVWKFTSHSAVFDGSTAKLSLADHADWDVNSGNFTFDAWVMFNSVKNSCFISQFQGNSDAWFIYYSGNALRFYAVGGGGTEFGVKLADWSPSTGVWYHIAASRSGNTYYGFIDGVAGTPVTDASTPGTFAASLYIGMLGTSPTDWWFNGWMDEVRWVKGTAKWTSGFTPPTAPYLGRTTTYPITTDRNNVLMISGEGADASTSIIDECGKTVTANGNAQIDTAQYKFGQSSILFDGTSDWLSLADSDDWDWGGNNFTVDMWIRTSSAANKVILTRNNSYYSFGIFEAADGKIYTYSWQATSHTENFGITGTVVISDGNWHHIAVTRSGSDIKLYIDGVIDGTDTFSGTIENDSTSMVIGAYADGSYCFTGWMDDIRISKGIARWTAAFTPPLKTTALINGDTDEEYRIITEIRNGYNGASYNSLRFNNDSGSNYGNQYIAGSDSAIAADRQTSESAIWLNRGSASNTLGVIHFSDIATYVKSGYVRIAIFSHFENTSGTTVTTARCNGSSWNNSTAPVASMIVSNDQTNGMDCGTKFLLYRKVR